MDFKRQAQELREAQRENAKLEREIAALNEVAALLSSLPPRKSARAEDLFVMVGEVMKGGTGGGATAVMRLAELIEAEWADDLPAAAEAVAKLRIVAASMLADSRR